MTIRIADPLGLLAAQNGVSDAPAVEAAAAAADSLNSAQMAASIGEPVPIVFCRQVSSNGGIFVSPKATEARYENAESTNVLTVSLMLVLSEGSLATVPIKDVFQGACRKGTWAQTYDRRAGTWTPGNNIGSTTLSGATIWDCPQYCGTSGRYDNMTTLSYINTFDDADTRWDNQVHVFVRNGMQVTRILDDTLGPSNNFIDLALYLIRQSSQIAETLIDTTGMTAAANFTNANNFFFNGQFSESSNLEEWLTATGDYFLLRLIQSKGKYSFKPRVPVNANHTINTGKIDFDFTFTEEHLLPDGFEIEYVPLPDRQDIAYDMIWRQQPDADIGFPRSTQVKYVNLADSGPYEQHDLSAFCAYEDHAVKVAAYKLARRKYVTHTLRITVRSGTYNSSLGIGDICRVRLRRETAVGNPGFHDYIYEIERIEKTTGGACVFTLTHFPIDSQQRSLVARTVAAASGPGVTIDVGRTDFSCDENSATDDTALANQGVDYPAFDAPTGGSGGGGGGGAGGATGTELSAPEEEGEPIEPPDNPEDSLEETQDLSLFSGEHDPGDELAVSTNDFSCVGQVQWFKVDKNTGERELISTQTEAINGNYTLQITVDTIDHEIVAIGRCSDPSTASGFGSPIELGRTDPIPTNTRVYVNQIQTSSDPNDTSEHLSWQGPAEIIISTTKCIACNGSTKNCSESGARPTFVITNRYLTSSTCQVSPYSGFAFTDKVAAASCNVSQNWKDTAIDIPTLQSYELFRTDSC